MNNKQITLVFSAYHKLNLKYKGEFKKMMNKHFDNLVKMQGR